MGQTDKLKENIEALREYLNKLIAKDEKGAELLLVSQQLDKLLVEYYAQMDKYGNEK